MTARINFTKPAVEALVPPSVGRDTYYDTKVPHLALLVSKAGSKKFYVVKKRNGRVVWLNLGGFSELSVEQARKEAQKALGEFAAGGNPVEAKKTARAEGKLVRSKGIDAWRVYVANRCGKWSESHKADHAKVSAAGGVPRTRGKRPHESDVTQEGILMPLLRLPLDKIDPTRVETWLRTEVPKRPAHARLAFGLLRAFLNWCSEHPDYSRHAHPEACISKKARAELPRKNAKSDSLEKEQLRGWFEEAAKLSNPKISAYLRILLLIGARRTELATLKWADVDMKWRSITLRDKVEGERTIPMTPYVHSLLTELQTINHTPPPDSRILNGKRIAIDVTKWKPSPWVFSSPTAKAGYLQDPSEALSRINNAAGVPHVTLHGLRRSFKSLSEWVEMPAGIVAQIMGHKPSATAEKHYTVRSLDLLRLWHTRLEHWLLEQAGIKQPREAAKQASKSKPNLRAVK